jgi:hypothetical protein
MLSVAVGWKCLTLNILRRFHRLCSCRCVVATASQPGTSQRVNLSRFSTLAAGRLNWLYRV